MPVKALTYSNLPDTRTRNRFDLHLTQIHQTGTYNNENQTCAGLFRKHGHAENIVEIAAADERFTTLVAAVTAAGLAETMSGPGPFTVYAPVNDAFKALPAGTVETLLKPENKGQLTDILLYHVDDRNLEAADIPNGSTYFKPLLTSQRLCITKSGASVTIDDGSGTMANVIIANIRADNGVIHVIDKVLMPGKRPACH